MNQIFEESEENNQNKQIIGIRVPFPIETTNDINKYLCKDDLQKIKDQQDNIQITNNPLVVLSKKKLLKSLYKVKVCSYKNKETGEIVQLIQESNQVTKIYDYLKMCDFYLPPSKAEVSIDQMKNLLRKKILDGDDLENYKFVLHPHAFLKQFNLPLPNSDLLVNRTKHKGSQGRSKHISFGQEIPNGPLQIPAYVTNLKIFSIVQDYFKKRPCWLRNVLEYQLKMDNQKGLYTLNQLKNILKYLSFTYRDGPWKHIFCRFGFDPRQDKVAALYQILIVKIKKKEVEDYDSKDQNNEEENQIYDPTFKQMPTKFLRIYQLCDIEDKRVQQLVKGATISSTECHKESGWFSKSQYAELQRIIRSIREQRSKA